MGESRWGSTLSCELESCGLPVPGWWGEVKGTLNERGENLVSRRREFPVCEWVFYIIHIGVAKEG